MISMVLTESAIGRYGVDVSPAMIRRAVSATIIGSTLLLTWSNLGDA